MEYDDQRRMYAVNIGDPNSSGLACISSGGTSVHVPQQTVSADHARLLVGSLLDASVVTISPQLNAHSFQQPVHHVLHQHQLQQTQQEAHHQHLSGDQITSHHINVDSSMHNQFENRLVIDSNNMYVSVSLMNEETLRHNEVPNSIVDDGKRCFVCNDPFVGDRADAVDVANTILTASRRKLTYMMTKLIGLNIFSTLGNEMCLQCFYLIEKIDNLEMELANAKIVVIRKCEATLECRHPGNKFPISWPTLDGTEDVESEEMYESPDENIADDPNDPDVTPASLVQSRKKKGKRKLVIKKKIPLVDVAASAKKKNFKILSKRGRGRPKKKVKVEASLPPGSIGKTCPCCQKIVELHLYLRHLQIHKVFPCPFCSKVYKRKDIKNHLVEAHQDEIEFPCHLCELPFDTFGSLRRHCMSVHMGIESERVQCPICEKSFSTPNGLKVHIETIHDNVHMFQCPICKEFFNQRGNMKNHYRRVHEGEQARKLQCDTCSKGFICPSDLRKHVERAHLKLKKSETLCSICSKAFSDLRALKVHVNAVHTKEVKFPCSDCKMVFHSLTNMVTHRRRMHGGNGGRKHVCDICTKAFCSPSDLRTHVKVVHENIRKYVCDICNQSFKVGSHLKYHRRRHTGETPYKCPHCGKCFHGPSHISDHVKKVHKTVYLGVNQRRRLNLPENAPPPPPGILPSGDSKTKLTLAPSQNEHQQILPSATAQVVMPPPMQPQQLSTSVPTMQHIPQHILPFGGQSSHMITGPTMMDQHVVHHGHYANIQFDQMNTQSPMPMVVRLLHDMQY